MPRLNLYEQQTSAQGPRASGADFGAAPAQALEGAGNALYEIGQRIQEREDLSERQRLRESFEEAVVPMLDDFSKRRDINTKESIPQFRQALIQKRQELVSKHAGNPESRAKLENQLDNLVSQYTKSAIGTKIKADQELMVRTLNQQFDKSALDTDAAPDIWSFAKDENLMLVEELRPGMSQDQYVAAKRLAYAKPLQSAVKSHLAQRNWDAAEAIMRDENFSKFLTAQEAIPLRIDVAVGRGKAEKEKREIEQNAAKWEAAMGLPRDPSKWAQYPNFDKSDAGQKAAVYRMANGVAPPPDVMSKFLGLDERGKERRSERLTRGVMDWIGMDTTQKTAFVTEAYEVWPTTWKKNDKGYLEPTTTMPGHIKRLVDDFERGTPGGPPTDTRPRTEWTVDPAAQGARDNEAVWLIQRELATAQTRLQAAQASGDTDAITRAQGDVDALSREIARKGGSGGGAPAPAPGASPRPAVREEDLTIDEMLPETAGVFNDLAGRISRTPLIGDVFTGGAKSAAYKTRIENAGNEIVSLLQKNQKFPEGERNMIANEVAKVNRLWDNPESASRNLYSIVLSLEERLKSARVIQNDTTQQKDVRDEAGEVAARLKHFIDRSGVLRPKDEKDIKTLYESGQLREGRLFWTPEGKRKEFTQEWYDATILKKGKK